MTLEQLVETGAKLVAIAAVLGPLAEFVVSLIVLAVRHFGGIVSKQIKIGLTGLLSIGGAGAVAGAVGVLPWAQVWIGAVFGLAAWLLAHWNHRANVVNEAAPK